MRSLPLLVVSACSDFGLTPTEEPPLLAADTGSAPPTSDDTASIDTATPADASEVCPTFSFCWQSPLAGELRIEGEFQAADGTVLAPWQDWTGAVSGAEVCRTWEVCPGTARFRGEGIAQTDADPEDDLWSCTRQGEGTFTLTGEVRFHLGGVSLDAQTAPDPLSEGCGVLAILEP